MCDQEDYRIFFDDAPMALLRTDLATGKFLMANKFAAMLFGCKSVEELLTKTSTDYYTQLARNRLIRKLRKTGTLQDQEIQLHLPDGRQVWVKANLRINCGGSCIECFLSDITELVEMREKELNKLKSLSDKIDMRMAALAS